MGDAPEQKGLSGNALVPVVETLQRSLRLGQRHLRSEAPFLIHLIATAELTAQTRTLRRATLTEAQAAYQSTWSNGHRGSRFAADERKRAVGAINWASK